MKWKHEWPEHMTIGEMRHMEHAELSGEEILWMVAFLLIMIGAAIGCLYLAGCRS